MSKFRRKVGCWCACVVLLGLVAASIAFFWALQTWHKEVVCHFAITNIGVNLLSYHDYYGAFPPAFVANERGEPALSWRLLFMSFGHYDQADVSKGWDHPDSLRDENLGKVFSCPRDGGEWTTNFVAVVGANTLWPGAEGRSYEPLRDLSAEKILLIELPRSDIHWLEPRDVSVEEAMNIFAEYRRSWETPTSRCLHCFTTATRTLDMRQIGSVEEFRDMLLVPNAPDMEKEQ